MAKTLPPSALTPKHKAELENRIRKVVPEPYLGEFGFVGGKKQKIPRPLTLQDVLLTLRLPELNTPFWEGWLPEGVEKTLKLYNLTHDYHHQSEAFYSFLYSLLFP